MCVEIRLQGGIKTQFLARGPLDSNRSLLALRDTSWGPTKEKAAGPGHSASGPSHLLPQKTFSWNVAKAGRAPFLGALRNDGTRDSVPLLLWLAPSTAFNKPEM